MKLTNAEWQLMNALWQGSPATARDVAKHLPGRTNWAYTTIKTMLTRLVAKGVVSETKTGNVSVYKPRLTRRRARLTALRSLVEQGFDGAFGSLLHFVVEEEKLSPSERRRLRQLLDESTGKGKRK